MFSYLYNNNAFTHTTNENKKKNDHLHMYEILHYMYNLNKQLI